MKLIQQTMLLKANYSSTNKFRLKIEEKNKVVWISIGKPNLWNLINSGMIFSSEASVTFEIEENRVRKPSGILKRFFGKSQYVIDGDVNLPLGAEFRFKD